MNRQQALDELTQLGQDMGHYDLPRLHLVNHVTGWVDDGQLVMLWRVVDDRGIAYCKWTTYNAASAYRERVWNGKRDGRQRGSEWDLMPG